MAQNWSIANTDKEFNTLLKKYGIHAFQHGIHAFNPNQFPESQTDFFNAIEEEMKNYRIKEGKARRERQMRQMAVKNGPHVMFVTLCHMSSCYGGHEEGGWWYTDSIPIKGAFVAVDPSISNKRLQKVKNALLSKYAYEVWDLSDYNGHGVGGCGDSDDFCQGEYSGSGEGWGFQYTYGVPFSRQPRPHYE